MDDPNKPSKRDVNFNGNKEMQEHNPAKWYNSNWEDQCILEAEGDSTAETLFSSEQRDLEQKLWLSFQNTASAIAQLYKDRAQGRDDMWISFQNAAEIATNMYKESIDGCRNVSDIALQCGYHKRNKELLTWAKKKRRHIRREDLIAYLCGRSPPHRRPSPSMARSPSLSRNQETSNKDNRLQTFHDAVSMNGLNGAMAGISFGSDPSLRHSASPGRNCQQDLTTFISDEIKRRNETSIPGASTSSSPSRKRPSSMYELKPSSPKRRK